MTLSTIERNCFISALLMFATCSTAVAQSMNEEQMQRMMQQAEAAQKCFANIDQSAMQDLQDSGQQMEAEIKALCAAGKRDEAMSRAMKYGKEMRDDPQLQEIRKCSEMMQGMMGQMPSPYMPPDTDEEAGHVCDDM
jgi:hypothetical protein